jgi:hypothetical protein
MIGPDDRVGDAEVKKRIESMARFVESIQQK